MAGSEALSAALDAVRALQADLGTIVAKSELTAAGASTSVPAHSVFISWAHSHSGWTKGQTQLWQESIATLASTLRQAFGVDADVDLFHLDENTDWTRFGQKAIVDSDRVVIVMSRAWAERWEGTNLPTEGAGAAREADALHGLYSRNQTEWQSKLVIAILPDGDTDQVPPDLDRVARVRVDPSDMDSYEDLLRLLTGQPRYRKPALGSLPNLPPLEPRHNLAALRAQLVETRRQERESRKDKSTEGLALRSNLEARKAALLGIIEASEQSEL